MGQGIHRALVLVNQRTEPDADLLHILLRWQEAGLEIRVQEWGADAEPRPISVRRPGLFRLAMYQFLTTFNLRRRMLGGFGGQLSDTGGSG